MRKSSGLILCVTMVLALCACSTTGSYQSSFTFNGLAGSAGSSRNLGDPRLYMDDDELSVPALSNLEYKYLLSNPNYH